MALCTVLSVWHNHLLVHIVEMGSRSVFHIRHPLGNPFTTSQQALLILAAQQLQRMSPFPSPICRTIFVI